MNFSKRSQWPTEENPLSLLLKAKKSQNVQILDLTQSNPTLCGFSYSQNPLFQNLTYADNVRYEPNPRGLLKAREAVVDYYAQKNVKVTPEQIFLTSSTSEAYTFLFRLLANSGETILAPSPGYPLFDTLAQLSDLNLQKYFLHYDGAWGLDEQSLADFSGVFPKALIWVNPNNPTGNFATAEEINFLNHFSAKNSCPLIIDEVFFDFNREISPATRKGVRRGFAGNDQTLTFTLSSISKILGLPQMKLSWIMVSGPKDVVGEACRRLEIIADAYLSVSTPVQHSLPAWLENRKVATLEILSRIQANEAALNKRVKAYPKIEVLGGGGGWYAVLRVEGISDENFCVQLLKEKNVLAHPGYLFDFKEENCVVINLLVPESEFAKGIQDLLLGSSEW